MKTLALHHGLPMLKPRTCPLFERLVLPMLHDARDLVFVRFSLLASLLLPAAASFYLHPVTPLWGAMAALYLLIWGFAFLGRFILMLHCTAHRPLFQRRHRILNHYIPWVLGPLFGETPETYFTHHIGMHHREENLLSDTSSTLQYRRDSLCAFLRYYARFMFLAEPMLSTYLKERGELRLRRRLWAGVISYWAIVTALFMLNPVATLVVLLVPLFVSRSMMIAGNWAQHAFIDPGDPADPYRNSITSLHPTYNRRCFNDGYHIAHHELPSLHFTQLPGHFARNLQRYGERDTIVFRDLDYFGVWFCLMTGRWKRLAQSFVVLPGALQRDEAEIITFLKKRTAWTAPLTASE